MELLGRITVTGARFPLLTDHLLTSLVKILENDLLTSLVKKRENDVLTCLVKILENDRSATHTIDKIVAQKSGNENAYSSVKEEEADKSASPHHPQLPFNSTALHSQNLGSLPKTRRITHRDTTTTLGKYQSQALDARSVSKKDTKYKTRCGHKLSAYHALSYTTITPV